MSDPNIHYRETQYGFEFGQADVQRCWSHKGTVCVRIKSRHSGQYVDIQLSPKGRKLWIMNGHEKRPE